MRNVSRANPVARVSPGPAIPTTEISGQRSRALRTYKTASSGLMTALVTPRPAFSFIYLSVTKTALDITARRNRKVNPSFIMFVRPETRMFPINCFFANCHKISVA